MELVRGHRTRVDQLTSATTLELGVTLSGPAAYDVGLFGLDASGRLGDDAFMIFFNQPSSPEGSLRIAVRPDGGDLTVDLAAVPDTIHRLVVTAAIDGDGTMAQLLQGQVVVRAGGREVARHTTTGADFAGERAVMLVELYRKEGWRLAVVGQGFAGGMAALVRHFGGEVDDEPAPPPSPTVDLGKVTLDAGPVSLAKHQTVSLAKGGAPVLGQVAMGLGWDPARAGTSIDLDASCLVVDAAGERIDMIWFAAKEGGGGAIVHSGDNLTGEGEGDDEVVTVDLGRVPAEADVLLFTVTSYKRHPFTEVTNAYCRLFDPSSGAELVRFALTGSEARTGVFMAALFRSGAGWDMTALGTFEDGRTVRELIAPAKAVLATLDRS